MVKRQSNWITASNSVIIPLGQQARFKQGTPTSTEGIQQPSATPEGVGLNGTGNLTEIRMGFRTNLTHVMFFLNYKPSGCLTSIEIPENIPIGLPFPHVFCNRSSTLTDSCGTHRDCSLLFAPHPSVGMLSDAWRWGAALSPMGTLPQHWLGSSTLPQPATYRGQHTG